MSGDHELAWKENRQTIIALAVVVLIYVILLGYAHTTPMQCPFDNHWASKGFDYIVLGVAGTALYFMLWRTDQGVQNAWSTTKLV